MRYLSRREFVSGMGLAAGAVLPYARGGAPMQTRNRRLIDVHHHIMPPKYINLYRNEQLKVGPGIYDIFEWTPQIAIERMDAAGLDTAIVSLSTPGSWFGHVDEGRRVSREVNEYAAQMVRDFPGRFGFFASIPLPDTEGSLKEIEYSMDTLHADGIVLMTSYDTIPSGDKRFWPVYSELNRRKAPVFFHRTVANCCTNLRAIQGGGNELFIDDVRCLNSMLKMGTLANHQDITFIWAHGSLVLPWFLTHAAASPDDKPAWAPLGVRHEIERIYVDTANKTPEIMNEIRQMKMLTTRVMFGTDHPYGGANAIANNVRGFRTRYGLDASEIAAIETQTALRVFPKYKG